MKKRICSKSTMFYVFFLFAFIMVCLPARVGQAEDSKKEIARQEASLLFLNIMTCDSHGKYFYENRWAHHQKKGPFEDKDGNVFNRGIGMFSDNEVHSGIGFAEYRINGNYSIFEADIALEKIWMGRSGFGSTQFTVYADRKELFSQVFHDYFPTKHIVINIPSGTVVLRLEVSQHAGSSGTHGGIWGNAAVKNQ